MMGESSGIIEFGAGGGGGYWRRIWSLRINVKCTEFEYGR